MTTKKNKNESQVESQVTNKEQNSTFVPTAEQVTIIDNQSLNTSQKIRALHATGMERGQIAKVLNKLYQHVRNVLITPIKTQ